MQVQFTGRKAVRFISLLWDSSAVPQREHMGATCFTLSSNRVQYVLVLKVPQYSVTPGGLGGQACRIF